MTITAEALRELHRIHRQQTDLRSRLDRGPKQINATDASIQSLSAELEQAKEANKRAKISSDDKQLQLKSREDRIQDLQNKLNSASSNKEYQALKEQIGADEQANLVLQDEILEALEKIDELTVKVNQADANLKKAQEEGAKIKERVHGEQESLGAELKRVQSELERAESSLPADFRADYERVAKARGEDALAVVEGEVCGVCFFSLTPQMMNELHLSKPVFCRSCGALLYLPEGQGT